VVVVFIVTVGGTLGFFVLSFGQVQGSEFTPDRFGRRSFAYFRIPIIRLQITPVVRWDSTNDLERHVASNALRQRRQPVAKRWDVVSVNSGAKGKIGDAAILCHYLDTKNEDGNLLWLEWTKSDEKRAKPLWIAVHHAASVDAYTCIPDLFEIAELHDDLKEMSDEINRYMTETLSSMADDRVTLEEFERAERLYSAALVYDEDNEPLKTKRDAILRRLKRAAPAPATSESIGS
jgi:hypothetical protein